ncbi:MAG: VWA domain-containing protein [Gammaproteobacteria bacterium]|nr:VWA domain-containing protein [Gammaproteobacteria bacterium]MDE0259085.1 VWA domain-containing protein [Gammaproteobacteria bacterium]
MSVQLARPEWLVLLALVPLWLWWLRPRRTSGMLFASAGSVRLRGSRLWAVVDAIPRGLRAAALACLIVALAHPRLITAHEEPVEGGRGIVVAVDLSTSMWADDMEGSATRLEAAKAAARRFVAGRDDAIGLVTFAGEALTRLPLTRDHYLVDHAIDGMEVGLLIDGTDIAGAIAAGSALLDAAPHDSKVLVLVTDGAHNRDGLVPAMAARAAAAVGVRIYPVAIGRPDPPEPGDGTAGASAPTRRQRMETVLTQAARITGGRYFSAADVVALDSIYAEIDRLETTSQETRLTTALVPFRFLLVTGALALVLAAVGLRASRWAVLP